MPAPRKTVRPSHAELKELLAGVSDGLAKMGESLAAEYAALRRRDPEKLTAAVDRKLVTLGELEAHGKDLAACLVDSHRAPAETLTALVGEHGLEAEFAQVRDRAVECQEGNLRNGMLVSAAHAIDSQFLRLLTGAQPVYGQNGQLADGTGGRSLAKA